MGSLAGSRGKGRSRHCRQAWPAGTRAPLLHVCVRVCASPLEIALCFSLEYPPPHSPWVPLTVPYLPLLHYLAPRGLLPSISPTSLSYSFPPPQPIHICLLSALQPLIRCPSLHLCPLICSASRPHALLFFAFLIETHNKQQKLRDLHFRL